MNDHITRDAFAFAIAAQSSRVLRELRSAGSEAILLRGASKRILSLDRAPLAHRSGDIDILVAPDRFADVERYLESHGWVREQVSTIPTVSARHADAWIESSSKTVLDLHRTLIGCKKPPEVVWSVLHAQVITENIDGQELSVLSPSGQALVFALHAAQHGCTHRRAVEELGFALSGIQPDAWLLASQIADELGASDAFTMGLSMARHGADVLGTRQASAPTGGTMLKLRASGASPIALSLAEIAGAPTLRVRLCLVIRAVFPPIQVIKKRHQQLTGRHDVTPFRLVMLYVQRLVRGFAGVAAALPEVARAVLAGRRRSIARKIGRRL